MFSSGFHRYQAKSWGQIISINYVSTMGFFWSLKKWQRKQFVLFVFLLNLLNWLFPFFFYICVQLLNIQKVILYVANMNILITV